MHLFQQEVCYLIEQMSCTVILQITRDRIKLSGFDNSKYLSGYIISLLEFDLMKNKA